MKVLEGYVENRTKEAALAAMMLALFFVTRTFKIQVTPTYLLDLSAIFTFGPCTFLSYPYTILFSLSTVYGQSHPFALIANFVATQVIFFLTKFLKPLRPKWIPHVAPVVGASVGYLAYAVVFHMAGFINFWVFLASSGIFQIIGNVRTYIGSVIIWTTVMRFGLIEEDLETS